MTTEQYAALVAANVYAVRNYYARRNDSEMEMAFELLASGAKRRCLTVGREYEVSPTVQGFESKALEAVIAELRDEVLDVPGYVTQVVAIGGIPMAEKARIALLQAAELLKTIEELEHVRRDTE